MLIVNIDNELSTMEMDVRETRSKNEHGSVVQRIYNL